MHNKYLIEYKKIKLFTILFFMSPLFAQAAYSLGDILGAFTKVVKTLIPVAFGFALLFFFWAVAVFVLNAGDEQAMREKRYVLFWGVIVLFITASFWGLMAFLEVTIFGGSTSYSDFIS